MCASLHAIFGNAAVEMVLQFIDGTAVGKRREAEGSKELTGGTSDSLIKTTISVEAVTHNERDSGGREGGRVVGMTMTNKERTVGER